MQFITAINTSENYVHINLASVSKIEDWGDTVSVYFQGEKDQAVQLNKPDAAEIIRAVATRTSRKPDPSRFNRRQSAFDSVGYEEDDTY